MLLSLRTASRVLIPAVVLLASATAHAQTSFSANLTNNQEATLAVPTLSNGAPRPTSFGTANFILNAAQTSLSFTATIFNIDFTGAQTADVNDNLVNAHIHAGATAVPGSNAGVVWGFFGNPFNDTNPTNTVVTPFATGVGGTVVGTWDAPEGNNTTLAAQLPFILSNRSYINFHTVQFSGGEIRGQIVAAPEPGSAVLLAPAILGMIALGARRRKA
jgi:hypothetical protein